MLASIFVVQGADAFAHPDPLVSHARRFTDRVGPALGNVNPNLNADARTLVRLNGAVMAAGGVLMVTPLRRAAAATVALSLVPTTLAAHSYWEHEEPARRKQQRIQFLKNLGLLGGLLLATGDTEGRPGLRWRTGHLLSEANRSVHREARHTRSRARAAAAGTLLGRKLSR